MLSESSITLAFTGASGLQYGLRLLECLIQAEKQIFLLVSSAAHAVAALELQLKLPKQTTQLQKFLSHKFHAKENQITIFDQYEWTAPIASGSNPSDEMIICPCSSGTLAAIAAGMSNNLIERSADVILKERKKLILVHRETPLSHIHLENMMKLSAMNAIIMPASPGFYHQPQTISDVIDFMVARILDHLNIHHHLIKRWGFDL
jgi:flavin prenyltransferase